MHDDYDGILSGDQIRTLITVCEHGSFQRAALNLGVKQPAVNQLVKRLEEKFGRRLFDRTVAGVTLTLDGEAVLIYARAAAKLGGELKRRFEHAAQDTVIRIGIGEEFSRTALPTVLAIFARLHPDVRFEAVCAPRSELLFATLDDGGLDVVVARQSPDRRSGEHIWTEPTIWAGRTDVRLPLQDPIPLVLPTAGGLREAVLTTLVTAGRTWRITFEGGSLSVLEAAVRAGLGITACTARMDFVQIVPLDEGAGLPPVAPSTFVFERRPPARVDDASAAFCDVLRTAARLSFSPARSEGEIAD